MKKISIIIASFLAGSLFATAGAVFAEDGLDLIKAFIRTDLTVKVNGVKTTLNNDIISVNGKTYLYLRDFEKFGMQVGWNAQQKLIDIITNSVPDTTYAGGTTQPDTIPIPNEVTQTFLNVDPLETWYSDVDLQNYLFFKRGGKIYNGITRDDGIVYYQYGDREYPTAAGKDIIKDKNGGIALSQSFILKFLNFLSVNDLSTLKKYKVDEEGKIYQY